MPQAGAEAATAIPGSAGEPLDTQSPLAEGSPRDPPIAQRTVTLACPERYFLLHMWVPLASPAPA